MCALSRSVLVLPRVNEQLYEAVTGNINSFNTLLMDVERGLWQAGYRNRDAEGREYRGDGETFADMGAPWKRSREMSPSGKAAAKD